MRSHFKEAGLMRIAVVNGVLSDAAAPAEALSNMEGLGKIDPSWQSSIDVLQYASRRIRSSSDVPAAAAAIADIGIACGACHKAVGGGPAVKVDAPPITDGSLQSRMRQHIWATDRLWEGLFVPSDASWKAGAAALSTDPFPKELLDKGDVHARSAAARFKSLVATAASQKKPAERGQLYATLLETCAACHAATRKTK
jgi:cytochrome c553